MKTNSNVKGIHHTNLSQKILQQEQQINFLSRSLKNYQNLFNTTIYAQVITELDGTIIEINQKTQDLLRYDSSELISKNLIDLIPKTKLKEFTEYLKKIVTDEWIHDIFPVLTKNHKKITLELSSKISEFNNKKVLVFIGKDITIRKSYQEQLENERNLFYTLMDNIPDRIYFKDIDSKFTLVNKAHAKNFHLEKSEDIIGLCDHDFFDKKHADQALADERIVIQTKQAIVAKYEKEKVQFPDREYEWVSTTKVPIINKNGKVAGIVGISRNVTALKNAEIKVLKYAKELQYLNATKDKFFSILAHDLKNPFFSLLGFVELLLQSYNDLNDEERLELINNILRISKNSYGLLENLLHWASSQTGRIEYRPKEINLKSILDDSQKFFDPIAKKKNIELKSNIKDPIYVYADSDMMRTVVRNLITNAIKFTKENGFVKIGSNENKTHAKIEISDNGVGMNAETLNHLFRIDVNHKSIGTCNEEGTGMGLIICKEFVEKNGGHLNVKSKLGKGSKFSFTVPKHT